MVMVLLFGVVDVVLYYGDGGVVSVDHVVG